MALAAALIAGVGAIAATPASAIAVPTLHSASATNFGPNVVIFDPTMSQASIQSQLDAIATQQVPVASQFTSQRYSIFFEPGTYGTPDNPLIFQVGYYTEVAGLGAMPGDTVINGAVNVFNTCFSDGSCNADDNFWRSLSNLKINVNIPSSPPAYAPPIGDPFTPFCANTGEFWAVSQAAPMRRVIVDDGSNGNGSSKGNVIFQDYCAPNNFASGGFIADSQVSGSLDFFGNQQYMVRNDQIGGAAGCPDGLWNMVYSGTVGAPAPVFTGQCEQNTVLSSSPVTKEKPFLYTDSDGNFKVFVPSVQHDTVGTSWASGSEAGHSISINDFFIASPNTSVASINAALARGKNLILTPGVYNTDRAIVVSRPNTVVLGMGFATIVPQHGNVALIATPNSGVTIAGLLIDAGPVNSTALMAIGTPGGAGSSSSNPDLVSDVFFRIGGAETTATSATVSLLDGANNSIIDDVWAWRADHGNAVGWTTNTADTGVVVTGENVTAYGLAVEHYQKNEVIWIGNGGTDVFFQNELPYDPPSQDVWNQSPSHLGYPAFVVAPNVKTFNGYGMGSYVVFNQTTATLFDDDAFQAPTRPGVQFNNVFTVWITGSGGFNSVINGTGGPNNSTDPGTVTPVDVVSYP
ncbi:MAG: adenylyl cyclase [Acidothermaceae bacterium]